MRALDKSLHLASYHSFLLYLNLLREYCGGARVAHPRSYVLGAGVSLFRGQSSILHI